MDKNMTLDYVGNMIYEDNGLKMILLDNGYYDNTDKKYYFYIKDHLGNNRIVADASGVVEQSNQFYPFGMSYADDVNGQKQSYKYNNKELDTQNNLNLYDYSARYMNPTIPGFTSVDPLAEKYYSWSPYVYVANNPLRFIDPTGMWIGDFLDGKGNVIGNDGIDDERLYLMKTNALKEFQKYIKDNSGNINAFRDADNIAYQNSIEIERNPTARQDMVNEVSKDNGKGGTKDAKVEILLPTGKATFHSHPSGNVIVRSNPSANTLGGGTTTTHSFIQTPSNQDISNAGSFTNYVFGRSDNKVYIYNSSGTQGSIPMNRFVTPKRKENEKNSNSNRNLFLDSQYSCPE